jgi:hypothetical protein
MILGLTYEGLGVREEMTASDAFLNTVRNVKSFVLLSRLLFPKNPLPR